MTPWTPWPTRLLCPWDSPGKNTGVGRHFLLQGIFLTQNQTCISRVAYYWVTWESQWKDMVRQYTIKKSFVIISYPRNANLKHEDYHCISVCCCSVAQSCLTFCNPMDCSMPGFRVPHHLPEFAWVHVWWTRQTYLCLSSCLMSSLVMLSSHLILWCPLLLLPSIFPSIRDFSNESSVHIR